MSLGLCLCDMELNSFSAGDYLRGESDESLEANALLAATPVAASAAAKKKVE